MPRRVEFLEYGEKLAVLLAWESSESSLFQDKLIDQRNRPAPIRTRFASRRKPGRTSGNSAFRFLAAPARL